MGQGRRYQGRYSGRAMRVLLRTIATIGIKQGKCSWFVRASLFFDLAYASRHSCLALARTSVVRRQAIKEADRLT